MAYKSKECGPNYLRTQSSPKVGRNMVDEAGRKGKKEAVQKRATQNKNVKI